MAVSSSIPPPMGEGGRAKRDRVGRVVRYHIDVVRHEPPPGRLRRPPSPVGGGIGVSGSSPAQFDRMPKLQTVKTTVSRYYALAASSAFTRPLALAKSILPA